MFGLGATELLVILALVLFLFGGKKLPELGSSLGRGFKALKQSSHDDGDDNA